MSKGEISFGDFDTAMTELNALGTEAMETAESVSKDLKNLLGDFWGSIDKVGTASWTDNEHNIVIFV